MAAIVTLLSLSSCSDDTPVTGVLRVQFLDWKQEWTNHVSIEVTPLDHEDIVLKHVDVGFDRVTDIELNPGNYHVLVVAKVYGAPLG